MSPEGSAAAPGARFVQRCCIFYLCALIGFWILSVGQFYAKAHQQNQPFSLTSILFKARAYSFTDFLDFDPVTERVVGRGPKNAGYQLVIPYPAPMMCVYILFNRVFREPLYAYLLFIILSVAAAAAGLIAALYCSGENRWQLAAVVGVSAILSYPLIFLLERGNMEGFVWAVMALGLTAFVLRHHKTAGVLFALAASMKVFPGILLLLLFARRRYKELAIAVVAFGVFTVIGLWTLNHSIPAAMAEVRAGLAKLSESHLTGYRYEEIAYDHSLFSILKQVLFLYHKHNPEDPALNNDIRAAALPYMLLVLPVLPAVYWFRIRKLPLLNQAIALIVLAVTIPYISFEYTLNHVYFAWALFLLFLARDVATGRESIPWPAAAMMLTALAFVFALGPADRAAGQLKTCALMVLLLVAVTVPMHSSLLDDEKRPSAEGDTPLGRLTAHASRS
jgi:glycosyl transferase family 87